MTNFNDFQEKHGLAFETEEDLRSFLIEELAKQEIDQVENDSTDDLMDMYDAIAEQPKDSKKAGKSKKSAKAIVVAENELDTASQTVGEKTSKKKDKPVKPPKEAKVKKEKLVIPAHIQAFDYDNEDHKNAFDKFLNKYFGDGFEVKRLAGSNMCIRHAGVETNKVALNMYGMSYNTETRKLSTKEMSFNSYRGIQNWEEFFKRHGSEEMLNSIVIIQRNLPLLKKIDLTDSVLKEIFGENNLYAEFSLKKITKEQKVREERAVQLEQEAAEENKKNSSKKSSEAKAGKQSESKQAVEKTSKPATKKPATKKTEIEDDEDNSEDNSEEFED